MENSRVCGLGLSQGSKSRVFFKRFSTSYQTLQVLKEFSLFKSMENYIVRIWSLILNKRWVISYQASRSFRLLITTTSSSGGEDQVGGSLYVHTEKHQSTTNPSQKPELRSAASSRSHGPGGWTSCIVLPGNPYSIVRGPAGCICRMSHLPAHFIETHHSFTEEP